MNGLKFWCSGRRILVKWPKSTIIRNEGRLKGRAGGSYKKDLLSMPLPACIMCVCVCLGRGCICVGSVIWHVGQRRVALVESANGRRLHRRLCMWLLRVLERRKSIPSNLTSTQVTVISNKPLSRALQALSDPYCDVCLSVCLSATLMLNILETKRFRGSCPIGIF